MDFENEMINIISNYPSKTVNETNLCKKYKNMHLILNNHENIPIKQYNDKLLYSISYLPFEKSIIGKKIKLIKFYYKIFLILPQ